MQNNVLCAWTANMNAVNLHNYVGCPKIKSKLFY